MTGYAEQRVRWHVSHKSRVPDATNTLKLNADDVVFIYGCLGGPREGESLAGLCNAIAECCNMIALAQPIRRDYAYAAAYLGLERDDSELIPAFDRDQVSRWRHSGPWEAVGDLESALSP